ncbi:MAG: serine hydrolase [Anaerolineae bacterium]
MRAQTAPVTAEAINQANLRASPDLSADLLGQIVAGTRYPVVGRSEFYPWVLVADPTSQQPIGWVFSELLTFQGTVETLPLSTLVVGAVVPTATQPVIALPTATLPASQPQTTAVTAAPASTATPLPPTTPPNAVTGTVLGEINVRYGPGTEYDRVGVAQAGDVLTITARNTQVPWVQVSYPDSPNGFAWVLADLLEIQGSLDDVPPISQTNLRLPTLTPTASVVQQAAVDDISPEFAALGDQLWQRMLEAEFDPQTSRFGALFLMNLKTGEALAFEPDVAFSGMSINKIAILTTLFGRINNSPDDATASIIAEAMICSENISTNKMLAIIGDGNPYTGADRVSDFLQQLGLNNTFIYTPYSEDPFITPQAPQTRVTSVDQVSAEPDPYNQMTVTDVGTLLQNIYQCAQDGTGALIDRFPGEYSMTECRKMLDVMSNNRINNFIEAGVPEGVRVAHKHGWIPDTHGDAGIVFSPGGDFILVIALHNPTWLEFADSVPVISESARDVYNYLNPDAPLAETHPGDVPTCNLLGNPAILDMLSPTFGETSMFQ